MIKPWLFVLTTSLSLSVVSHVYAAPRVSVNLDEENAINLNLAPHPGANAEDHTAYSKSTGEQFNHAASVHYTDGAFDPSGQTYANAYATSAAPAYQAVSANASANPSATNASAAANTTASFSSNSKETADNTNPYAWRNDITFEKNANDIEQEQKDEAALKQGRNPYANNSVSIDKSTDIDLSLDAFKKDRAELQKNAINRERDKYLKQIGQQLLNNLQNDPYLLGITGQHGVVYKRYIDELLTRQDFWREVANDIFVYARSTKLTPEDIASNPVYLEIVTEDMVKKGYEKAHPTIERNYLQLVLKEAERLDPDKCALVLDGPNRRQTRGLVDEFLLQKSTRLMSFTPEELDTFLKMRLSFIDYYFNEETTIPVYQVKDEDVEREVIKYVVKHGINSKVLDPLYNLDGVYTPEQRCNAVKTSLNIVINLNAQSTIGKYLLQRSYIGTKF